MLKRLLFLLCVLACGALHAQTPAAKPAKAKKEKPPRFVIAVVPGALRYATTRFDVTAGTDFAITLRNTCIMPHNLVLVQPGKADEVVMAAMGMAEGGFAKNFVPDSKEILASTKVLNPGLDETLELKAPTAPGEYPYLCTFPGHGTVMRGIMRVRPPGEALETSIVEKLNTAKLVDALGISGVTPKPMGTRLRPYVMRSFVPNPGLDDAVLAHHDRGLPARPYNPTSGNDVDGKDIPAIPGVPGGIAVSFGPDFAYVWDSTECRLLYAWTGGFFDMSPYWGVGTGGSRKGSDYVPWLDGTLVYKAAGAQPLQLGKERPKFRGYRVLSGNPEFTYELGGQIIHEHITPTDPGTFMIHYRIDRPPDPVRLTFDPAIRAQISCDQGSWKENTLEIPADHADHFMLLVKFQPGETFKPDPSKLKKGMSSGEP
jgi:azurin